MISFENCEGRSILSSTSDGFGSLTNQLNFNAISKSTKWSVTVPDIFTRFNYLDLELFRIRVYPTGLFQMDSKAHV